jgi:hypothetical protein
VLPKGYSVSIFGKKGIQHHRVEGDTNPADEPGASAIAVVHVENCEAAIHRTIGLVCACRQAGVSAGDLFWLQVSADWGK